MKKKIIVILILIYLLMYGIKTSYSMYNDYKSGRVNDLTFAKIIFNNEEMTELSLPIDNVFPGNSLDYKFKVSNKKDGVRSEINTGYNITIETYHLIPIAIKLYQLSPTEEFILECNDTNYNRDTQNKLICTSEDFMLNYSEDISNEYKLSITFNDSPNEDESWSVEYTDLIDFIDIKINSWQIVS